MLRKRKFEIMIFALIAVLGNFALHVYKVSSIQESIRIVTSSYQTQKDFKGLEFDSTSFVPVLLNILEQNSDVFIRRIIFAKDRGQTYEYSSFSKSYHYEDLWLNSYHIKYEKNDVRIDLVVIHSLYQMLLNHFILYFCLTLLFILYRMLTLSIKRRQEHQIILKKEEMAKQVAHDIRSPLAALDMLMQDVTEFPEEKRHLIRNAANRIRDIANDLLEKNRHLKNDCDSFTGVLRKDSFNDKADESMQEDCSTRAKSPSLKNEMISSLLESIVSEKRIQYRSSHNIDIELILNESSYGLFSNIDSKEFKRALSNLINNSCEAISNFCEAFSNPCEELNSLNSLNSPHIPNITKKGFINISLQSITSDELEIVITDNGPGIPDHIISRLGQHGVSHGKQHGNGLGIFHAKSTFESWNGRLAISSKLNEGTTVSIKLPKSHPPKSFVSILELNSEALVIVADDDQSIHSIWKNRLGHLSSQIKIQHCFNPDQIIKAVTGHNYPNLAKSALFLIDYEYLGHKLSGLDIIMQLNLHQFGKKTALVTSRFEDHHIRQKCEELGIGLIPKELAGLIPISLTPLPTKKTTNILLDDDDLVRLNWKYHAKDVGVDLDIFSTRSQLFGQLSQYSKDCTFYLDSNLIEKNTQTGEEIESKGEDIAKELYDLGYYNLVMATGYEAEHFEGLDHIAGVIGKRPPF